MVLALLILIVACAEPNRKFPTATGGGHGANKGQGQAGYPLALKSQKAKDATTKESLTDFAKKLQQVENLEFTQAIYMTSELIGIPYKEGQDHDSDQVREDLAVESRYSRPDGTQDFSNQNLRRSSYRTSFARDTENRHERARVSSSGDQEETPEQYCLKKSVSEKGCEIVLLLYKKASRILLSTPIQIAESSLPIQGYYDLSSQSSYLESEVKVRDEIQTLRSQRFKRGSVNNIDLAVSSQSQSGISIAIQRGPFQIKATLEIFDQGEKRSSIVNKSVRDNGFFRISKN